MKILVTGACGYKGTVLVPKLLEKGHEVVALDTQWFGNFLPKHQNLTNIKGDVIECGVGWGGSSFEIAKVLKGKSKYKKLYALDVFESLPPHDIYDSAPDFLLKKRFGDNEIPTYANKQLNYEIDLEKIKRWFLNDDLTNTIFLKRKFIDSFKILNEKRFCFAHVDAGNYLSIKQSAEFLKNRIEPGGITLFDDYNRERFKGLNNAITDLFDEGSLKFITPHGAYWIAP